MKNRIKNTPFLEIKNMFKKDLVTEKEEKLRKILRSLDNCYIKVKKTSADNIVVNIEQEEFFCDTFSLKDVIQLIALVELFFSTILIIISFEHIFPHGQKLFFIQDRTIISKDLGIHLFLIQFCGSFLNILSIIFLFICIKKKRTIFLLPHIIWQILYIILSFILTIVIMYLVINRKMLRGSAEAFLFMILIPLICQIYFIFLFIKFYHQIGKNERINTLVKSKCITNLNNLLSNGLLEFSIEREKKRLEMMDSVKIKNNNVKQNKPKDKYKKSRLIFC
uniref:Asparaginase n=1 Tax=Strongyloides stercoralis TaxID=6248 RepID=A0A0K0DY16_STRER